MRHVLVCLLLVGAGTVTGCATPVPGSQEPVRNVAATPARRPVQVDHFPKLRKAVHRYLAGREGRASLQVTDLRGGTTFGYREDEGYVVASVAKVDILLARLLTGIKLSQRERRLTRRMIRFSDNIAADALYRIVGDSTGLSAANARFGLRCTFPYQLKWGASSTCPSDQVALLKTLTARGPIPSLSRAYALELMGSVTPSQRWGVSAAARPGDRVALKNGWTPLRYQGTGWAINSVGRITGHGHDFLIAVLSAEQPSMAAGIETVEHLARMTTGALRAA
ncbi:serine hydrolase [Actinocorallia longicatena]